MRIHAACCLLMLGPAHCAFSQSSPTDVLVTGSRIPGESQPSANITVVTREQLDRQQPTSVIDVLRHVPGLHIDQKGGRGGVSAVYMRGADPNYTLVLIDGIAVNDSTDSRGGAYDFSTLDPADIERIEIVRGPLSAIYGGNAVAGVINVITRRSPQDAVAAQAHVGSHEMHRVSLRADAAAGASGWSMALSEADDGEQVDGDRFRARQFSGAYSYVPNADVSVGVNARHLQTDRNAFPDDSGGALLAVLPGTERRDSEETSIGAALTRAISERWEVAANLNYLRRSVRQDSPGVAPGARDPFGIPANDSDTQFERAGSTVTATVELHERATVVTGFDVYRESGDVTGSLDLGDFSLPTAFALDRTQWAWFTEAAMKTSSGWAFRAGLRLDDSDEQALMTNPRLSISYDIPAWQAQVGATWGKGFKLPSMYALGDPTVGNSELRPERSSSYEFTVSSLPGDRVLQWQLTYFDAVYRDAIDFDPGPPPQLVNRLRIDTHGFEASATARLRKQFFITADVLHAVNDVADSDRGLRNRPEWRGSLTMEWVPSPQWSFAGALVSVGDFIDSSVPTGEVRMPSYSRLDLSASRAVGPHARLIFRVANVTDEDYQEYVGFPAPGAVASIGAKLSL